MLLDIFPLRCTQKHINNDSSIFLAEEKYLEACHLKYTDTNYIFVIVFYFKCLPGTMLYMLYIVLLRLIGLKQYELINKN